MKIGGFLRLLVPMFALVATGLWITKDELGNAVARYGVGQRANPAAEAAREFMSKLAQEFPEEHAAILAEIRRLETEQATPEESYLAGQSVLSNFLASRVSDLAYAQESALNVLAERHVEALELVQRDSVIACAEFSRGLPVSSDTGLAVSTDTKVAVIRSSVAYLDAVISGRHSQQTLAPLTQEERMALLSRLTTASLNVIANDGTTEFSAEQVCASEVEYWQVIVQSPPQLRARAAQDAFMSSVPTSAGAEAAEVYWYIGMSGYGRDASIVTFIDANRVEVAGNTRRAWVWGFVEEVSPRPDDIIRIGQLNEYDCTQRRSRTLQATVYYHGTRAVPDSVTEAEEWSYVTPGTPGEWMLDFTCGSAESRAASNRFVQLRQDLTLPEAATQLFALRDHQ